MIKKCCKCGEEKSIELFSNNKRLRDGKNNMCKPCMREYDKQRFANMSREERDERLKDKKQRRERYHEKIYHILKETKCIDCGIDNPVVLEFDHRENKDFNIADCLERYKWETVKNEIDKCDVRCANCHRLKTSKEFNHYKNKLNEKFG